MATGPTGNEQRWVPSVPVWTPPPPRPTPGEEPPPTTSVIVRGLVGLVVSTTAAWLAWYLMYQAFANHGLFVGGALGGALAALAGCPVGYFASDQGRWRGLPAAVLAGICVLAAVATASYQAIDTIAIVPKDVDAIIWLHAMMAALGAFTTARKPRWRIRPAGDYAGVAAMTAVAAVLGGVLYLQSHGGQSSPKVSETTPTTTTIPGPAQIKKQCQLMKLRSISAIKAANASTAAGHPETPTWVDNIFGEDNPWYTYFDTGRVQDRYTLVPKGTPPC